MEKKSCCFGFYMILLSSLKSILAAHSHYFSIILILFHYAECLNNFEYWILEDLQFWTQKLGSSKSYKPCQFFADNWFNNQG